MIKKNVALVTVLCCGFEAIEMDWEKPFKAGNVI